MEGGALALGGGQLATGAGSNGECIEREDRVVRAEKWNLEPVVIERTDRDAHDAIQYRRPATSSAFGSSAGRATTRFRTARTPARRASARQRVLTWTC